MPLDLKRFFAAPKEPAPSAPSQPRHGAALDDVAARPTQTRHGAAALDDVAARPQTRHGAAALDDVGDGGLRREETGDDEEQRKDADAGEHEAEHEEEHEEFGLAQLGGKKKRRRSKRVSKKKQVEEEEVQLPAAHRALLVAWDATRLTVKQLDKMHVRPTLENIGKLPTGQTLVASIRSLAFLCEEAVVLDEVRKYDDPMGGYERRTADDDTAPLTSLETLVRFPAPLLSAGRRHTEATRRAAVVESLLAHVRLAHAAWLAGRPHDRQQATWHPDFPLEALELPAEPIIVKEQQQVVVKKGPVGSQLAALEALGWYVGQAVQVHKVPARPARYGALRQKLVWPPVLKEGRLYTHQARAIEAALKGEHVGLCTGTASGKTVAYSLPTLQAAVEAPGRCVALFIFPTKALAQDQLAGLKTRFGFNTTKLTAATLDGDSTWSHRSTIANSPPSVLLTNPDMLHYTLLPNQKEWRRVFQDLRFVIIDEAHVYVGAFGAHVACLLRRLRRAHDFLSNNDLRFICASATIANPQEHLSKLVPRREGEALTIIDEDGSPCGEKTVVLWNPPIKKQQEQPAAPKRRKKKRGRRQLPSDDDHATVKQQEQQKKKRGGRRDAPDDDATVAYEGSSTDAYDSDAEDASLRCSDKQQSSIVDSAPALLLDSRTSSIVETAKVFTALVKMGVRTVAFARTRKLVELVLSYSRQMLREDPETAPLATKIAAYRAGYSKEERRNVETLLFGGVLIGCVATCALELGVDIGDLDATVHLGHPGSVASLRQQSGRAGRKGKPSVAVVVCWDSPLDQFYARNGFGDLSVEAAALDIANECVLREQLLCAAAESPLTEAGFFFPASSAETYQRCLEELISDAKLIKQKNGVVASTDATTAAAAVNLRMIDPITFEVKLGDSTIDSVPYSRAFYELYEGAVYLHQGTPHLVVNLDLRKHEAQVRPMRHCSYLTSSRNHTDVDPTKILQSNGVCCTGCVHVSSRVWGYRKVCKRTHKVLEMHEFTLPPLEFDTRATWIDLPQRALERLEEQGRDVIAGIHAANHAILAVLPLFVLCDTNDIATEHNHPAQQRPRPPRIIVYDARPGGVGVADKIFTRIRDVLDQTLAVLRGCRCGSEGGCPACLHVHSCSASNVGLDKIAATIIIEEVLAALTPTSPVRAATTAMLLTPRRAMQLAARQRAGYMDTARVRGANLRKRWGNHDDSLPGMPSGSSTN